jgi:hypothetical protein
MSAENAEVSVGIRVDIMGHQDGEERRLPLAIDGNADDELQVTFSHLREITGEVVLPSGFVPDALVVEIRPQNRKFEPISKVYLWSLESPADPT